MPKIGKYPPAATKEFFVPVDNTSTTGVDGTQGNLATVELDNTDGIRLNFKVPHDFSSLIHCKVLGIKATTGTIDWTVTTNFAAIGESYAIHSDTDTGDGLAMTDPEVEEVDISAAFTNLDADDYVGVKFALDAISAGTFNVIGIVFKYS